MKSGIPCRRTSLFLIIAIALFTAEMLQAATLYWDTSDTSGLQGGSGTWSTTVVNWNPSSAGSDPRVVWNNGDTARFAAGSGTITLGSPVTVEGMFWSSSSGSYTYDGDSTNYVTWTGIGGNNTTNRFRVENNANLTMNVPIYLASSSAKLAIHANNDKTATVTFNGVISGSGSVETGSNNIRAVVFNADNTFSGTVTVGRGGVQFNGQNTGLGTVSVTGLPSGNVLGGTGSIALNSGSSFAIGGNSTITSLAYVAPGATIWQWDDISGHRRYTSTIGTLSVASDTTAGFEFQRSSRLQIEVGSAGQSDRLAITGNLTFNATNSGDGTPNIGLQLWSGTGAFDGSTYTIMTWTGDRTRWFNYVWLDGNPITGNVNDGWDLGNGYTLQVLANSAVLIPEPASVMLLVAGGLLLRFRRRR